MKRLALVFLISLTFAPAAMAQSLSASPAGLGVGFTPRVSQSQPTRRGFTVLTNYGLGFQRGELNPETAGEEVGIGLAAINLGLGGFVTGKLALMGRFTGTIASSGPGAQFSGVAGSTVQYWLHRRVAIEGGAGMGFATGDFDQVASGFGIIAGVKASLYSWGSHHIVAGVEYAPAFTDRGTIHNIGFVVGYQLTRIR